MPCPVFPLEMTTASLFVVGFEISFDDVIKKADPKLFDIVLARKKAYECIKKKKMLREESLKLETEIEKKMADEYGSCFDTDVYSFIDTIDEDYEDAFNCQPLGLLLSKLSGKALEWEDTVFRLNAVGNHVNSLGFVMKNTDKGNEIVGKEVDGKVVPLSDADRCIVEGIKVAGRDEEFSKHEGLFTFVRPHDDDKKNAQYGELRSLFVGVPLTRSIFSTCEFYGLKHPTRRFHNLKVNESSPEDNIDDLQEARDLIMKILDLEDTPDIRYMTIRDRCNCC